MLMTVQETDIPDVKVLEPARHGDSRGFLSEVFRSVDLEAAGIHVDFVQDNHTLTEQAGTIRGLHYQLPPHAQAKLVRVSRGAIYDVALDLRASSPTFGRHVAMVLSAEAWNQLYIPPGFAHGFCTLEPGTEVIYKLSDYYVLSAEGGVLWSDPALGIDWPIAGEAIVSERDTRLPLFNELPQPLFP